MDVIESAIAENHYHVFRFQHRNDSIENRSGVLFVKSRMTRFGNCIYNGLRIQSFPFWDLLQPGDLRYEHAIGQL